MTQKDFNKILLTAFDESLALLGNRSKQALLRYLVTSFQPKEDIIQSNLAEFKKALEDIFGRGATYLEKLIVKRLHEKLGLEYEKGKIADILQFADVAKSKVT